MEAVCKQLSLSQQKRRPFKHTDDEFCKLSHTLFTTRGMWQDHLG